MDKQWKDYTHDQYSGAMYNGYGGVDEYGYSNGHAMASKSSSLHKNYRAQQERAQQRVDYNGDYQGHGSSQYHPSLERRQYEQQQYQQQQHHSHHSRRSQQGPAGYELNDRHHAGGKFVPQRQLQPDYYFMPHQRKYSSDVVRVFVDYDAN